MKENKHRTIKMIIAWLILICSAIGCYGVIQAPDSDQSELEAELERNEALLEQAAHKTTNSPSATAENTLPPISSPVPEAVPRSLTVIGDSVFLGAAPAFLKIAPKANVDAKVSRQVYQALDVAKKLDRKNKLGDTVILSLGTNGNFNPATGEALIEYLGTERTIYWINAYGKKLDIQKTVNASITKIAEKYDNVQVIPWAQEGKKHPDWFYQDGVHLNAKGQSGFAEYIWKMIQSKGNQ